MKTKDIDKLTGKEFEDLIFKLVRKMDFIVEERKRAADGGIDIKAINENPLFSGKYIIQCKRYKKPVGSPPIRDLYGVVSSENANKGILITNSTFTKAAKDFARGKAIELIDGNKLISLLDEHLKKPLGKKQLSIKVHEAYVATLDSLKPQAEKLKNRRQKIRKGLIFLGHKEYKTGRNYIAYIQKKASKAASLSEIFHNQLNYLNNSWNSAIRERENYNAIREVKLHTKEMVKTLKELQKEWEDTIMVDPPQYYEECKELLAEAYKPFFFQINRFVNDLANIVENPKTLKDKDYVARLDYTVSIEGWDEKIMKAIKTAQKKEKGGCFIATAVYGSYDAREVVILRRWRDSVLLKNTIGRFFTKTYYKLAPNLSRLIHKHSILKSGTQYLLNRLIKSLS